MMPNNRAWYHSLQTVAVVVTGLTALGTGIVVVSKYINLPQRVEASEKINVQQDKQLDRLIALQEFYQRERVKELADDGEIKTLVVEGVKLCCDGRECWKFSKKDRCNR